MLKRSINNKHRSRSVLRAKANSRIGDVPRGNKAKKEFKESDTGRVRRISSFAKSLGINDSAVKQAMKDNDDNIAKALKQLNITSYLPGATMDTKTKTKKMAGSNGLYMPAPEPYNSSRYNLGDRKKPFDWRIENTEDSEFRPVLRSQDRRGFSRTKGSLADRLKKQDVDAKVREAVFETPRQAGTEYLFPSTDFDFNLEDAVISSLANYQIKKNKYKTKGSNFQYSAIAPSL